MPNLRARFAALLLLLLLSLAASASASASGTPSLYASLTSAPFLHAGTVSSGDAFEFVGRACSYLEPENVTVAPAQGIGWTEGGSCPTLYACNATAGCSGAAAECEAIGPASANTDRAGGDYRAFQIAATPNGTACAETCCAEGACRAWAYTAAAPAGQEPSCAQNSPCCYLKAVANAESPAPGVFSGTVERAPPPRGAAPPMGMRSAAPLGGLGAGALELRADGTIHEVTIINMSPAGAAKFGVLEDMILGARVGGVARALRTAPPAYAAGAGVSALTYSALYPLARLAAPAADFAPAALAGPLELFAYSKLLPGDPVASAAPAVVFTLAVANAGDAPLEASLFLSLPLASVNDCARASALPLVANLSAPDAAACLAACAATAPGACASWTWSSPAAGGCRLARDVPLSVHAAGAFCGVRGAWTAQGAGAGAATLSLPCAEAAPSPACGDATLRAVLGAGAVGGAGAAADAGDLWRAFAASGSAGGGGGGGGGGATPAAVGHGAASVTLSVPPRANATLSIVLAWSFPHRDHAGEDIGNFYSTLFGDSAATASSLAAPGALEQVAADLSAHHAVFAGAGSSLPDWLADVLVNAVSHFRGMIWSRDGRMREFEAFDCMDLDSIHNDYQRHLPYMWLAPQFEAQKLRKWASGQDASGFIQEFLGPFGVGPFDIPGGRIMGDTTTLWVVELLELWRNTGDDALVAELYPAAARAVAWLIGNAAPLGLPEKLYCTYDILWLDGYNTTTYNSFLYMAALKAGQALAEHAGDAATASAAAAALVRAQAATQKLLWQPPTTTTTATTTTTTMTTTAAPADGFFRAYSYNGDSALMADALYGQVVAISAGLGLLADPEQLASHLRAELARNSDPFGFVSITNRTTPPPAGQKPDDSKLWQQAGPDWSSLAIMLGPAHSPAGANVTAALDPAFRQLDNWRSRLHNLWNLAGLTSSSDAADTDASALPYCTAHYGFALTAYWLLPALSGQQTDLPGGTLSFAPALACPMRLPAMLAGATGTIACNATGTYTLALAFGALELPPGGLSAGGRACADAVSLGPGDAVSW